MVVSRDILGYGDPVVAAGKDGNTARGQIILLAMAFVLSLPLTASINYLAGASIGRLNRLAAVLVDMAVPSCLLIAVLFGCFGDRSLLKLPSIRRIRETGVVRLSVIWIALWLAGSFLFAVSHGRWFTYTHSWPTRLAFLIFGPIGEELLFRGMVQGFARRIWRVSGMPAILIATAAFSLHHLFLQTAPDGLLVPQLLFTVPMGIVFGTLRERTGSLWPGLALHILTNAPFAF